MNGHEKKPGAAYYAIPVLAGIAGITLFVYFLYTNISLFSEELIRVVVPGKEIVTLSKAGGHIIFHEYESELGGETYRSTPGAPGMRFSLVSRNTGEEIPLKAPTGEYKYSMGGRAGVSMLAFHVKAPGEYEVSAWYENGASEPRTVIAIGGGVVESLLATIFTAVGILLVSAAVTVIMFAIIYHRRNRPETPPGAPGGPRPIQPGR